MCGGKKTACGAGSVILLLCGFRDENPVARVMQEVLLPTEPCH